MTTGLDLRHEGQAAVVAADVAPHRGYGEYVRDALDLFIGWREEFDADDIRVRAGLLALNDGRADIEPHSPNLLPAILGGYVASGRIVRIGEYHSCRKSRRYGRNGRYRAA